MIQRQKTIKTSTFQVKKEAKYFMFYDMGAHDTTVAIVSYQEVGEKRTPGKRILKIKLKSCRTENFPIFGS